ncbi:hypothetical protein AAG570_008889 [Ranatra chinensis]|uniref:Uncharacterized protein n=1 Tax=Ranatra chinensis TaxID=642074 RepID=A0ABD0YSA0_9HEMI
MLEEQLSRARSRVQYTMQLEADLLQQKQTINELSLEKEANQEKLQELFEENAQLTLLSKSALLQDNSSSDVDQVDETSTDNSLSEQLSSNAQARALRLELENKRLASTVENLQEAALQQTNERVLQLEKDKKKLSLQVEEIEESKRKLQLHISELENTVKNAQRDTKKMQEIRDSLQAQIQSRIDEVESVTKEKLKLENRLLEAERALEKAKIKEEQLEELAEVKAKVVNMEKEITRLKDTLEVNSIAMDKLQCETETISKEKLHLISQVEDARNQISRLQEVERELKDLDSKYEVEKATIVTLQRDLVAEKLNSQQMKLGLEKLGLPADYLTDPDNALDRIVSNPGVLKAVRERLAQEQSSSQTEAVNSAELATVNAQLEVNVSTLQSQIASLTSQHTALQLANSQLAAEKDEVAKELDSLRREHQQLLVDQLTLQGLHEQLGSEYESLVKDRDTLKGTVRESRVEARGLKDSLDRLSAALTSLQQERDCLRAETNSLNNLRAEHSKLKDDFRNLFTANEKAKSEYRGAQEEYRTMRSEVRKLTLNVTELQGVIATRDDRITHLEIELSKLHSQCGMLKQVTSNLEEDRRSLMEHVTLLLGQYHELLTHSLEDKEHYHLEEKMFTDKLNNLCRQKEKLEEKIMEHYRRMESCPAKKLVLPLKYEI